MHKVVVFGGGTGLSWLLSGLKLFPIDVTTVIAVSDNGSSTGALKEELNIPAVGDVGKVLLSMANADDDLLDLLRYRFSQGSLENHPIRNILLAALIDVKGNLTEATRYMSRLLQIKGTVLPLTEEKVDLVGLAKGRRKKSFFGEEEISQNVRHIDRLKYDHEFKINQEILEKIAEADLLIFSPGSLYTSIIPHLLSSDVRSAIAWSDAPIMYVCNLVTQPGETDDPRVSSHVEVINRYLRSRKVDYVVANDSQIDPEIRARYLEQEGKEIVTIDGELLSDMETEVIPGDIFCIEDGMIRHNALKTAYMIFSFLMDREGER